VGLEELFERAVATLRGRKEGSDEGVGAGQGKGEKEAVVWALKFDVGGYFEGEGFWTDVEVRFKTEVEVGEGGGEGRKHWHVPLLLSPWSYTTYRGS